MIALADSASVGEGLEVEATETENEEEDAVWSSME